MDSKANIVPFGKYKGQPVEVVQETDPKYIEWMAAQDFVKQRFGNFYQVIINNCQVSDDTPEHNKMQSMFLDDKNCTALTLLIRPHLEQLAPDSFSNEIHWRKEAIEEKPDSYGVGGNSPEINAMYQCEIETLQKQTDPTEYSSMQFKREFEPKGCDLKIDYKVMYRVAQVIKIYQTGSYYLEFKPSISDDYPGIFRQIKSCGTPLSLITLVVGDFTAKGCTQDQFIKMAPCKVVFLDDILKKASKLS